MADIGLQQVQRDGSVEPGMVTTGDELSVILRFLSASADTYSAATAVKTLMSQLPAQRAGRASRGIRTRYSGAGGHLAAIAKNFWRPHERDARSFKASRIVAALAIANAPRLRVRRLGAAAAALSRFEGGHALLYSNKPLDHLSTAFTEQISSSNAAPDAYTGRISLTPPSAGEPGIEEPECLLLGG